MRSTKFYRRRSWWDGFLEYETLKVVKIRDWRLGAVHFTCLFGIAVYIFLYAIWWEQGYMSKETPTGTVRATLAAPKTLGLIDTFPYCQPDNGTRTFYKGYSTYPCQYLSANNIAFPVGATSPLFLTTRYKIFERTLPAENCTPIAKHPNCIISDTSNNLNIFTPNRLYTAGLENYTVFIDHIVYALSRDFALKNIDMKGNVVKGDKVIKELESNRTGDIFTVKQILDLADIDLDGYSGLAGGNNSYRYDGVTIMCAIKYSNRISNANVFEYEMKFVAFPGVDTTRFDAETTTVQTNRHGIVIFFIQTGMIGKFDFQTLLMNLVSGLLLMGIATSIVDILAIYILPEKKKYGEAKYQKTDKMSEVLRRESRPIQNLTHNMNELIGESKDEDAILAESMTVFVDVTGEAAKSGNKKTLEIKIDGETEENEDEESEKEGSDFVERH